MKYCYLSCSKPEPDQYEDFQVNIFVLCTSRVSSYFVMIPNPQEKIKRLLSASYLSYQLNFSLLFFDIPVYSLFHYLNVFSH